jgi:hypothetical protein
VKLKSANYLKPIFLSRSYFFSSDLVKVSGLPPAFQLKYGLFSTILHLILKQVSSFAMEKKELICRKGFVRVHG